MLRPAVLTVLCDQAEGLHGYAIEKELAAMRFFRRQAPDYTGLYRLLRQMEKEGLLCSAESESRAGPSKRVYRLTERGRGCLSRWVGSLREYRKMLDDLLVLAEGAVEVNT